MSKKPKEFVFKCEHMGGTTWTVEHQWAIEGEAEEIVRCCDCKFYAKDPDPIDPGWPMMCERTGSDMVEPYGYCAWGERSES